MMRITLIILAVIVSIAAIFVVAIYGLGMDNPGTQAFNRFMPFLPAAMVNGRFVLLSEVEERLAMYESAVNFQSKDTAIDRAETKQEILKMLIDQAIVGDLVRQNGVSPSNPDLEEYYRYVSRNYREDPSVVFGASEKQFREHAVVPDLWSKSLHVSLLRAAKDSKEFQEAQRVKILLDQGLDFGEAVKTYSQDGDSKYLGGDMGLFLEEEINPWLKDAALALSTSSTSDVLVSPDGYRILRVSGRNPGPPVKIGLQHILIRGPDFEEYLQNQRKNYRIYSFLRD